MFVNFINAFLLTLKNLTSKQNFCTVPADTKMHFIVSGFANASDSHQQQPVVVVDFNAR